MAFYSVLACIAVAELLVCMRSFIALHWCSVAMTRGGVVSNRDSFLAKLLHLTLLRCTVSGFAISTAALVCCIVQAVVLCTAVHQCLCSCALHCRPGT